MNYRRTDTTATFVDACLLPGAMHLMASADDESAMVSAPFSLTLFGVPTPSGTPLHVSSNGFVSLMTFDATMTFYGTIPTATAPNGVVAAYWMDLVLGSDGVCVATTGSAPSRRFIVQWKNAQFYSGTTTGAPVGMANFEVVYNESDRSIDYLYPTLTGMPTAAPSRAAVGIENLAGTGGLAICAGGRTDAMPAASDCTAVTAGTRFKLVPSA